MTKNPLSVWEWIAKIRIKKVKTHIGTFDTPEEAAHARDEAAFEQWCSDAVLNFQEYMDKELT